MNDRELLRKYLEQRDERAFAELVARHIDLVYSAARRQTKSHAMAEEITQSVFIRLVERAHDILSHETIPGWLLVTTRYVVLNAQRTDARRRKHEYEAAKMKPEANASETPTNWDAISPTLDDAMSQLGSSDRDALVLRYFQNKSLHDVGVALRISEPAAQKRINRAVHRLRSLFARRGIAATDGAICTILAAHAMSPAPQALCTQVVQSVISTAQIASGASTLGTKGAALLMALTKTQVVAGVAVVAVIGLGGMTAYVASRGKTAVEPLPEVFALVAAATTAPAANSDWSAFAATYSLEPNQSIRRILPPYLAERADFYRSLLRGRAPRGVDPEVIIFASDGAAFTVDAFSQQPEDLRWYFQTIAGISAEDTDLPAHLLNRDVRGDWVIRTGSTREQRVADFVSAIQDVIGEGMTLRLESIERPVIVVRGTFKFVPIDPHRSADNVICFYRDSAGPGIMSRTGGSNADIKQIIQALGAQLGLQVVIEGPIHSPQRFHWEADVSTDVRAKRDSETPDPIAINEILGNVAKQTSLTLSFERRSVPTWRRVKATP